MKRTITLFVSTTLFLAGCALDGSETGAPVAEEAPVHVTSIQVLPDGTQQVRTTEWSRAQLREAIRERVDAAAAEGLKIDLAEMGLSEADLSGGDGSEQVGEAEQAIMVDPYCGGASLWITDNGSYSDTSHMICFTGDGTMAMPSAWIGQFWGGTNTPVALWAGPLHGQLWFVNSSCDAGCSVPFTPYEMKSLQSYPGPRTRYDGVTQVDRSGL